ncbi:MAG: GNVR domain-containing protein [Bacillota bacterium]|jgi:polysaccharide chain length determinant protein (PEP-CTERM system associated)|nr:GNVR domain-containing protein [Bacillota bacterium]HPU61861.1 GNVR domain-containing protein [Bacillota bacterium]
MDNMDYEIDLLEMLRVLARRAWQIAAFAVLCMVAAYFLSSKMPRIYEATSTIMVQSDSAVMSIPFLQDAAGSSSVNIRNYAESLKSRTMIEATLNRLRWLDSPNGDSVKAWQDSLSVQQVQGTDIARLSVESSDPVKAAMFLNALVEVFQERTQQMNQESAKAAKDFIAEQLAIAEERLTESENALLDYKETTGLIEPSSEVRAIIEKISDIDRLMSQAEVELQAVRSRQEKLYEIAREIDPTIVSSTTIVNNPLVQQQKQILTQLEVDLAAALKEYTENHPIVIGLMAQIDEVSAKVQETIEKVIGSETMSLNPVYQDVTRELVSSQGAIVELEAKIAALDSSRKPIEAELASVPEKEIAIARLERNRRVNEEVYIMLRSRYEEMRISEAMKVSGIYVLDEAVVPTVPVKPRKLLNTAIAGILGFFVAVGATFILEQMDRTIKSVEEVEVILGAPVLGTIPHFSLVERIERVQKRRTGEKRTGKRFIG